MKFVPPSVDATAFNCPHCSVLTSQSWFNAYAKKIDNTPLVIHEGNREQYNYDHIEDARTRKEMNEWAEMYAAGGINLEESSEVANLNVANLNISRCRECNELTVWHHTEILHPRVTEAPPINPDAPTAVREHYAEASAIFGISSRGSAALLRLAIQTLLSELGGKGKDINEDISRLAKKGLDSSVIQAMDILRVVGNNAVHPGQIDFKDDRGIALSLFLLFNMIVDKTISERKRLDELYSMLPEGARKAIAKRDASPE